jgi:hypothetical protein
MYCGQNDRLLPGIRRDFPYVIPLGGAIVDAMIRFVSIRSIRIR